MAAQTTQTVKRPPNRVPLTELRRLAAVRRDVEGREGADRRGNLRLGEALGMVGDSCCPTCGRPLGGGR